MMKVSVTTLVLLLLLTIPSNAQQVQTRIFGEREKVDSWLKETKVPALAIGVIKNGKLSEIRLFGDLKKDNPALYNAIFNVASLTKPITAMLALKLVNKGELQLDEPLSKYWVDPDIANDPRNTKITIRYILSHQTGFKNWRRLNENGKLGFDFEPGTKFQYSGEGYEYLKKVLENKYKKSFETLASEMIFSPLGMKDTRLSWNRNVDESRFAGWHDSNGKIIDQDHKITSVSAADNLLTTIEDYGKFSEDVIRGGGLSSQIFDEMIRGQVPTKQGRFMGLGWELFTDLGPRKEYALTHSGGDPGVQTLVILLPVSKQGLIVFTNGDNGSMLYERIIVEMLDVGREMMNRIK